MSIDQYHNKSLLGSSEVIFCPLCGQPHPLRWVRLPLPLPRFYETMFEVWTGHDTARELSAFSRGMLEVLRRSFNGEHWLFLNELEAFR